MTNVKKEILCVVGARPNFTKIAPIMAAMRIGPAHITARLLHTGQHYDKAMKHDFFDQLGIPEPDIDLEVGSGSHTFQTATIMLRFETVLEQTRPAAVLVVGDVNSTVACSLVAVKKGVAVIHVEAGLRSYDRAMPEEINRVLTDQMSDLLFTTERSARDNLLREGIAEDKIHFVGNVMIDTLMHNLKRAVDPQTTLRGTPDPALFTASSTGYAVVTLHRPSNVDDPSVLRRLIETLRDISATVPLVFPVHPRTEKNIQANGLGALLDTPRILRLPPLSYLELLGLMAKAKMVLTDSGGIQEETTALGIPCVTMRENTERPITAEQGTNTIVGTDPGLIRRVAADILETGGKRGRVPEYWDGRAAHRIVEIIADWVR